MSNVRHNNKVLKNTWPKTKRRKILCRNPCNTESFVFDSTVKTAAICDFAECDSAKRKKGKNSKERKNRKVTDKIAEENSFQWHQTNADEKMSHLKKFSDYMHISNSS